MRNGSGNDTALTARNTDSDPPEWWLSHAGHPAPEGRNIQVLIDLIINHNVDMFYVGHQGQFDAYVHSELKKLKQKYPQINYAVVLAYLPGKKTEYQNQCIHTLILNQTICHCSLDSIDL